jgi:hypothetical protein
MFPFKGLKILASPLKSLPIILIIISFLFAKTKGGLMSERAGEFFHCQR